MIVYLCNALDEKTKHNRHITTDSPAATKKVFGLCHALQHAEIESCVLSMGRGRQNGSGVYFSSQTTVIDTNKVIYTSFWHVPLLTHIVSVFSLATSLWKVRKNKPIKLLVYNRSWHYFLAILLAKALKDPCYLDLEDGWVSDKQTTNQKILTRFYDWACDAGSLLACDALKEQVRTSNNLVCYGISSLENMPHRQWSSEKIQVLFGGSLCEGTGVHLFIQGIQILMEKHPMIMNELQIVIVGFGDMAASLKYFSLKTNGLVEFRGSVSNDEYNELLGSSHGGLCLKLTSSDFHDSTFPSKVIEISSHDLLLLSTPVSDVPNIFSSDSAILLEDDSPDCLAEALFWVGRHRSEAESMAKKGRMMARERFSREKVGTQLANFFDSDSSI